MKGPPPRGPRRADPKADPAAGHEELLAPCRLRSAIIAYQNIAYQNKG